MTHQLHLSFQNVEKRFGENVAIADFSLDVRGGEWVVLLGPSGCGKTTLLRLLSGLETLSAGRIAINEADLSRVKPKDRGISYVFQDATLFENLTVRQNLTFALNARGVPQDEQRRRINKWSAALHIEQLVDRKSHELSGGEQQRVAIAQALVQENSIVIFDEPLSNLDAVTRRELRSELLSLRKEATFTVIYVTHDQTEAMALADRICIMRDGQIVQIGSAEQLYHDPNDLFVGRFFGQLMNIFDAHELAAADWSRLRAEQSPGEVIVGVRPEHVSLSFDRAFDNDGSLMLEGEVRDRRFFGATEELELAWCNERILVTTTNAPSTVKAKAGTKLIMNVKLAHVYLFDRSSGCRIRVPGNAHE